MEQQYTREDLMSMRDILRIAIRREEEAYEFYKRAYEQCATAAERRMFERLMQQELDHKRILSEQLEDIEAQMDIDRALSEDFPP